MTLGLAALALAGAAVAPAAAADPTFNFRATTNSSDLGTAGNTRTFTSNIGNLSVIASAYSTASGTGPLQKAFLGSFTPGLGVTNNVTPWSTTDNSHTVDNSGWKDYIVFQFSAPLKTTSISLSAFGGTSFQAWTGNLPAGYDFTNANLATLAGVTSQGTFPGGTTDRTVTFSNFSFANYLIIGADPSRSSDAFKIAALTVVATPGPVAGTGVLALVALAGAVFARRRSVAL